MSWIDFFQGFPMIFFRSELAVSFWASQKVPYWQSYFFALGWTSLTLLTTYYGVGILLNWLKKWWGFKTVIGKWEKGKNNKNNSQKRNNSFSEKTTRWVHFQKSWVLLILAFIPYTHIIPGLGSAVIAATKPFNIKHGAVLLLLGNAVRWSVIIYHIYQGVQFFLFS